MAETAANTFSYSQEEEKYIIRNKDGVPVGTKPHTTWTWWRILIWVGIALLGGLGWTMLAIVRGEEVNAIWFVVTAVCTYMIAYRFYARYLVPADLREFVGSRFIVRPLYARTQAEAWFAPALSRVGDARELNSVAALPLYHIFALTLSLLSIRSGGLLTLIPNPRDIPGFVKVLKKRPFHLLPAVNTLFNGLLQNADFRALDFSKLAVSQAGGMAATEATAKAWQKTTGSAMIEGWGMSETCAIGTNNPVTNDHFSGNIGLPLPSIRVAINAPLTLSSPTQRCA